MLTTTALLISLLLPGAAPSSEAPVSEVSTPITLERPIEARSHAEAFIYGRVTTRRGVSEGRLRWGDEEASWSDIFDSRKSDRPHLDHVPPELLVVREDREVLGMTFKHTHEVSTGRHFMTAFGNIRSLEVHSSHWTVVETRDGRRTTVERGPDLRGDVWVWPVEQESVGEPGQAAAGVKKAEASAGPLEIPMGRILRIDFLPTPRDLDVAETRIYGTVELDTSQGFSETSEIPAELLSGFITWDKDERLSSDVIDGYQRDENTGRKEHNVPFGDIAVISNKGNESLIELVDGSELTLGGTNDVNDNNRGIWISSALGVRTLVRWNRFSRLSIKSPAGVGMSYESFGDARPLSAKVSTSAGVTHSGEVAFDADEDASWDVLSGHLGDIELDIPFALIKSVEPGDGGSLVELWSGESFQLDGTSDVGEGNLGVVIYADGATHVAWSEVAKIEFAPADQ